MNNVDSSGLIPPCIGQKPLVGSFYAVECTLCGWVGSSETLTDDCQCTQEVGNRYCLGDTDEIGTDRLLGIIQAMARRNAESEQAHHQLAEHANETERHLNEAAQLLADIAKSGQAYRECTDKSSPTGQRISAVLDNVARSNAIPDEQAEPTEWHMNPCKQGHTDVGAAGGEAHCYQCDEKITADTTQEAFELWNASHPASPDTHPESEVV